MARANLAVCAVGVGLLTLAGCAANGLSSFAGLFALESETTGSDRIVSGSLDMVAQNTQAALSGMGLACTMNKDGETVRLKSKTAKGAEFAIVLTRVKGTTGEQTRVHLEWTGPNDEQFGFQLLAQLASTRS